MRKVEPLKKQHAIFDATLRERLYSVIPAAMEEFGFDMWIVACRENNEDPVYLTMVPAHSISARRLSCLVFSMKDGRFTAYNLSEKGGIEGLYTVIKDPEKGAFGALSELIRKLRPQKIGINTSRVCGMCDGMGKQLYDDMTADMTAAQKSKLCSAHMLATRWLEARTEKELSRYRSIFALATDICGEAFSSAVITPGVTTTTEVEEWIMQEINRLGLTFWFHPDVSVQRKGVDSLGLHDVIIEHGDMLHYDVGLTYFGLCTDNQRLGYVLREGELDAPEYLKEGLRQANRFQDIVAREHITGRTGNDMLLRALEEGKKQGLRPMLYNHPIGFHGHGAGTVVGMVDKQQGIGEKGDFPLHKDTCYALELNTQTEIAEWGGQNVRFALEETVAFLKDGELSYMGEGRDRFYIIK